MSKKKEIEAMAIEIGCDFCRETHCKNCSFIDKCPWLESAERLYTAGYRKQSEGEWHKENNMHTCSLCGFTYWDRVKTEFNYCPNCGARMKGEKQWLKDTLMLTRVDVTYLAR